MSTIYKVCKKTIEKAIAAGPLTEEFKVDMQGKLDIYLSANKITKKEYTELSAMLA